MNAKLTISELKAIADEAESEAQKAFLARKVAIARSIAALASATKARKRYLRACGSQGKGEGSDGG